MKTKKYLIIGMVLILCFTAMSMQAAAHNPRYMKLDYKSDTLDVLILHFSFAPKIHYVYKVDIEKNGVLYSTESYTSQPKFLFFRYSYNVTATTGDELTVNAYCSLFGKITRSTTI